MLEIKFTRLTFVASIKNQMGATIFESETMTASNKALFVEAMNSGDYSLLLSASKEIPFGPGVYCIFNSKLNRLYIGCSVKVRSRISQHFTQLRNGQHVCHEMTIHYMSDPESFFFFCIEELDRSLLGPRNSRLFRLETKNMLLAPKAALYNNITPVIESDIDFNPDASDFVAVSDICAAIDMSPDAIRANGLSITDSIDIDEAIEFVRKRTVATGRWTQEKADKALSYLSELEQIKSESNIQISWEYRPSHEKMPFAQAVADVLTPTVLPVTENEKESNPEPEVTTAEAAPEQHPDNKQKRRAAWPMYIVMLLAAGTTVPNMYSVTLAIKANEALAALFTGCFTIAPFLLIYAGIRGFAGIVGVSFIILIEIFCNTAGIYGGLTGLNHSNFIAPTNFLHMATGFAMDSAYEPTARAIAVLMALAIAVLMVVSVQEIRKIESSNKE